ncbi:MAG: Sua5/YciO/YrdC/YwlC family protein, partial [Draconibacterium sp.]|nr:Sua5/YciO/YrdC/YwlC family protein [Draconibacterium sp.]
MKTSSIINIRVQIKGLVQGVGFRPFVYRIALKKKISGWVKNQSDGVVIEASGENSAIQSFISDLKNKTPAAAQIQSFKVFNSANFYNNGFEIIISEDQPAEREITQIGPDIAVCDDCLEDMKSQKHRTDYPFINCTNCGPRFSIICDLPYDRDKTTMVSFEMCPVCKGEYEDPADRRFHAQPVACLNCGPQYKFFSEGKENFDLDEILKQTTEFIDSGKIVAVKGIGGFFMACDARNGNAVERLRRLKNREGKPFAVMFRDLEAVKQFCFLNNEEERELISWQRPIVILKTKNEMLKQVQHDVNKENETPKENVTLNSFQGLNLISKSVSNGINTIGALLPYMPFNYLLFKRLKTPAIVFTSGNFSDEPIVISNQKAENDLLQICDAVVSYN